MMCAAKTGHKAVDFDVYEEGAVISGLNKLRTEQLERGEPAGFVSEVMLKILRAPARKARSWGSPREPSVAGRVGRGGATEQASFYRESDKTSKQSPRRRDEAR